MCGASPEMRSDLNRTSPLVGFRNDAISLNSVDLPAPFGPITERISSSCTAKLTSSTATSPPKRWDSPERVRSSPTILAPPLRKWAQAQEAVRQDQHECNQD